MESVPVLITVPARAESMEEIDPILQTLASVRATAPEAMVLVVDDRSPAPCAEMLELAAAELDCAYVLQQDGEGRCAAYNVGLSVALEHDMDACLVDSGLVLDSPGWLARLSARTGSDGTPAAIAGGAVVESVGVIRHAGYFFSLFRRAWRARLNCVPQELLDVHEPLLCPVGAELQLVRRRWIAEVGFYDELLEGPNAALDYCLRVSAAGGQCVLEPSVRARALGESESSAEPDDDLRASQRLRLKHVGVNFHQWTPEVI